MPNNHYQDNNMVTAKLFSKRLFYTLIFLSVVSLSFFGCGGGSGSGDEGGNNSGQPVDNSGTTTSKEINAFSINGITGTVNETAKGITLTMPNGTDVTALVATFTTTGMDVKVGDVSQASGAMANDFTNPVLYTVTAADGTTSNYTVTVIVASISSKSITAFSLNGVAGIINEATQTIVVTVPNGTDVTALVATFTFTGANVQVAEHAQISGITSNDFTNLITYSVTAADGTVADYTVLCDITALINEGTNNYWPSTVGSRWTWPSRTVEIVSKTDGIVETKEGSVNNFFKISTLNSLVTLEKTNVFVMGQLYDVMTYSPGYPSLPSSMEIGTKETTSSDVTSSRSGEIIGKYTIELHVVKKGSVVTVPAGTFTAVEIAYVSTYMVRGYTTSDSGSFWVVDGVGTVKSDGDYQVQELASYEIK